MLVECERLRFDRDTTDWLHQALALPAVELVPVTPEIAVRASQISPAFLGDPADRLIAATTQVHAGRLVTRDERLTSVPDLATLW